MVEEEASCRSWDLPTRLCTSRSCMIKTHLPHMVEVTLLPEDLFGNSSFYLCLSQCETVSSEMNLGIREDCSLS